MTLRGRRGKSPSGGMGNFAGGLLGGGNLKKSDILTIRTFFNAKNKIL